MAKQSIPSRPTTFSHRECRPFNLIAVHFQTNTDDDSWGRIRPPITIEYKMKRNPTWPPPPPPPLKRRRRNGKVARHAWLNHGPGDNFSKEEGGGGGGGGGGGHSIGVAPSEEKHSQERLLHSPLRNIQFKTINYKYICLYSYKYVWVEIQRLEHRISAPAFPPPSTPSHHLPVSAVEGNWRWKWLVAPRGGGWRQLEE